MHGARGQRRMDSRADSEFRVIHGPFSTSLQQEQNLGFPPRKSSVGTDDEVIDGDAAEPPFESIGSEDKEQGLRGGSLVEVSIRSVTLDLSDSHQPCHKTSSKHLEGENSGVTVEEDDLMTRLAASFKKDIKDALKPLLGPVASVLQSHGEAERKRREKSLALEEEKLARRREKLQRERRSAGRFQQRRRASSQTKSSRLAIRHALRLKSTPP